MKTLLLAWAISIPVSVGLTLTFGLDIGWATVVGLLCGLCGYVIADRVIG